MKNRLSRCFNQSVNHCTILLLIALISSIGCGNPTATTTNSSNPKNDGTESSASETPAASNPSTTNTTSSNSTSNTTTQTTSTAVVSAPPVATKPPATKSAEWKKPVAKVSPERAAAWELPKHDTLKLLALREWRAGGLIACSAQSLDGKTLIVAGTGLSLWTLQSEQPETVLVERIPGSEAFFTAIKVSPDGKWFAVADSLGNVATWSLEEKKSLATKKVATGKIVDVAISTDGKWISTTSFDSVIYTWSSENLEAHGKFKVKTNGVKRIEFASPQNLIVLGETASVWNVNDGSFVKDLEGSRYNFSMGRSNDAKTIYLGSEKKIRKLNGDDLTLDTAYEGNFASEELISATLDASRIATLDGSSLRIWDSASKKTTQWMDVYGDASSGLHWMEDGKFLIQPSSVGLIRVWGTTEAGEALGMKPIEPPLPTPAKIPASSPQALQTLDLRMLPPPPESQITVISDSTASYMVPLSVADTKLYYRYLLGNLGWLEGPEQTPDYGNLMFRKDGFLLSVSTFEAEAKKTTASLDFGSNLDMQTLPKADGKLESVYANANMMMYSINKDLLSLEVELIRKMHADGWTLYTRLHAAQREDPDRRELAFVKGGADIHISIQKSPMKADLNMVQYTRFLSANSLPIPNDSGVVELESVPMPYLVAVTKKSIDEIIALYDKELAEQGWYACKTGRVLKEEGSWIPYVQGAKDLLIGLRKMESGETLVLVGDRLQSTSWQLKALMPEKDEEKAPSDFLEAADLPILKGAKGVRYDALGKTIEYSVNSTPLADLASQYTEAMAPLGWEAEKGGIRDADYTFFNFQKGKKEIAFRAHFRDGKADVNIAGDGLVWTKPLPDGKKRSSFLIWLQEHKYPASLEKLNEFEMEMKAIAP